MQCSYSGIRYSGLLLAIGCADNAEQPTGVRVEPSAQFAAAGPPAPRDVFGQDAEFLQLADSIPGFAGLYVAADGDVVAQLADLGQRSRATAVLGRLVERKRSQLRGRDGIPLSARIRHHQVKYNFIQLVAFKRAIKPLHSSIKIVYVDIDEVTNRLSLGVRGPEDKSRFEAALAQLGVPVDGVVIEVGSSVASLEWKSTGHDVFRPTTGGIRIGRIDGYICTLGFNVYRSIDPWSPEMGWTSPDFSTRYFLTNSHCTRSRGGGTNTERTILYQPSFDVDPGSVGVEEIDRDWTTDYYGINGPCPPAKQCRFSDAALFRYETSVNSDRTTAVTTYWNQWTDGSRLTESSGEVWSVYRDSPYAGLWVSKSGATTGWTRGPVSQTCVDTETDSGQPWWLYCQDLVAAFSGPGDSGGPAWALQDYFVSAYGLLWGGRTQPPYGFFFSKWWQIEQDLGWKFFPEACCYGP